MHNIQSNRTDDAAIEQEIIAKGKTAPRITPADIEENIIGEHYYTAEDGSDHSSMAEFCKGSSRGLELLRLQQSG